MFNEVAQELDSAINRFFTESELDELAKETGFSKRVSKITGSRFLDLMLFNPKELKRTSLNNMTIHYLERHKMEIKKQSLFERFNENAVLFLSSVIERLLKAQISSLNIDNAGLSKVFNEIRIKDSTCFQLPQELAADYPGSGGSASPASVRIQFEYDLLVGAVVDLNITPFIIQDQTDSKQTLHQIKEGSLILRDLGYVNRDFLKTCISQNAYFIVRLQQGVKTYELEDGKYKLIDWKKQMQSMRKTKTERTEKEVYLYENKSVKVRLLIILLPKDVYDQRIRKAEKQAKTKGRSLSTEFKIRARFNLFITNIDEGMLDPIVIDRLYKLRWQVELVFKVWKSIYDIAKVKKVNKHRFECYLYSKLITIMINWKIVWKLSPVIYQTKGIVISHFKSFDILNDWRLKLLDAMQERGGTVMEVIVNFYNSAGQLSYEKKKGSMSTEEILMAINK